MDTVVYITLILITHSPTKIDTFRQLVDRGSIKQSFQLYKNQETTISADTIFPHFYTVPRFGNNFITTNK